MKDFNIEKEAKTMTHEVLNDEENFKHCCICGDQITDGTLCQECEENALEELFVNDCAYDKTGECKGDCEKCYKNSTENNEHPGFIPREEDDGWQDERDELSGDHSWVNEDFR